jgi:hypothetical protein
MLLLSGNDCRKTYLGCSLHQRAGLASTCSHTSSGLRCCFHGLKACSHCIKIDELSGSSATTA